MCIHAIPGTCGFQKTWINKMNGKQCLAQLTLDNEYLLIMILTIRRAGHKTTISIPILCHWPTNTFMSLQISFSFFFFFNPTEIFFFCTSFMNVIRQTVERYSLFIILITLTKIMLEMSFFCSSESVRKYIINEWFLYITKFHPHFQKKRGVERKVEMFFW